MKKLIVAIMLLLVTTPVLAAEVVIHVALVDVNKVFQTTTEGKKVQADFEKFVKKNQLKQGATKEEQDALSAKLTAEQKKQLDKLSAHLLVVMKKYQDSKKYDLILNSSVNPIIGGWISKPEDITDAVIVDYDKKF